MFRSRSDSWGEEIKALIEKKLPLLREPSTNSFSIGVPMQPDQETRDGITQIYALRGYKVEWERVPDFGYNVVVSQLSS